MADLPVEIWLKICRYACVDDGATGRALSAVSRYVRETTAQYHYRAVAVHGPRQACKLFEVQQVTYHARCIRHMYLTDPRDYMTGLSIAAMPRRPEDVAAMRGLLELSSPTLETLTIVSHTSKRTFPVDHIILDDLHFPRLVELTLRGCYSLPLQVKFAPNLVRLHVSCDVLQTPFARLIPKFYPKLTHLRISRLEYSPHLEDVLRTLCCMMGLQPRRDTLPGDGLPSPLPPATRFILVEPGPGHWIGPGGQPALAKPAERALLRELLNEQMDRLVVLPPYSGHSKESEAAHAKAEWIDRFNGGLGCWVSLNSEKSVGRCVLLHF